jgi:hypothetical protein
MNIVGSFKWFESKAKLLIQYKSIETSIAAYVHLTLQYHEPTAKYLDHYDKI